MWNNRKPKSRFSLDIGDMINLLENAMDCRAKKDMSTTDMDIALGWLTSLHIMESDGRITLEAADELRNSAARLAGEFAAMRLSLDKVRAAYKAEQAEINANKKGVQTK